ncbi:hypothetical protein BD289DRAFT_207043 [Coniella lustricola]|uniref:Uncharacterized protein n=1 Tax=Coniella lustricola TaxID=2025994 RepID=A0A2T2ZSB7_9PEZI|nr:hypothetical protein BD289DRAFT_207043 [Coniella lustricola]
MSRSCSVEALRGCPVYHSFFVLCPKTNTHSLSHSPILALSSFASVLYPTQKAILGIFCPLVERDPPCCRPPGRPTHSLAKPYCDDLISHRPFDPYVLAPWEFDVVLLVRPFASAPIFTSTCDPHYGRSRQRARPCCPPSVPSTLTGLHKVRGLSTPCHGYMHV